jgi:hypothetical protein
MTQIRKNILVLLVSCLCLTIVQGQSTIPSTGGNANGSGGSVSYTVGQITYQTSEGTTGTVAQGVQQPYEISVVTAIGNTEGITLEYKVFPNPTSGLLRLIIKPFDQENFRYKLNDINSILLQDKKIDSEETEISMENCTPAIYFLQVIKNNQEAKVFKIIKK